LSNYYEQNKSEDNLIDLAQDIFKKMKGEGRNYIFYLSEGEKIKSYQKLGQSNLVKGLKMALI
ncbi:MAG: hypothetical protein ACOCV1_06510, partial [Bacillota bacterium]